MSVLPGIHYFMGDLVDEQRQNADSESTRGECCAQYHGAKPLSWGGNSRGTLYGGRTGKISMNRQIRSRSILCDTDRCSTSVSNFRNKATNKVMVILWALSEMRIRC